MEKDSGSNRWLIVSIAVSLIVLLFNVLYAVFGPEYNKSNILTLISGWISGIATALVGVIAFVQNKRYKADSDDSLEKQYQFEMAKLILNSRTSFVKEAVSQLASFIEKYDVRELIGKQKEISILNNPSVKTVKQSELEFEIEYYFETVKHRCSQLCEMAEGDKVTSKEKDIVIQALKKFSEGCKIYETNNPNVAYKYILPVYDELVLHVRSYSHFLENDMDLSIKRIREYSYIVEHYGLK